MRSSKPAWVAKVRSPPLASVPGLADPSQTITTTRRNRMLSDVPRASASVSRIMASFAAVYASSSSSAVPERITRSLAASAEAINRSNPGPQSPGRSVTEVSRKRLVETAAQSGGAVRVAQLLLARSGRRRRPLSKRGLPRARQKAKGDSFPNHRHILKRKPRRICIRRVDSPPRQGNHGMIWNLRCLHHIFSLFEVD